MNNANPAVQQKVPKAVSHAVSWL